MSTFLLLFLVFFPFLAAYFVYPLRRRGREYRNLYIRIIPGVELLAAVMLLLFSPGTAEMPQVCGLGLRFEAGSLHTMLAMLSAFLWLMTALPCKEYFADREGVNRYYCSWLMTLGALMGVFLAADLFTLFVFFEIMPSGKLIGLDKGYALEQICAGDVLVEYDKLIDRQMERAAITSISGFAKLFTDAGKVLAI